MSLVWDLQNLSLLITSLVNITLAGILYFYGKRNPVTNLYALNILCLIGWAIAMMFYRSAAQDNAVFFATLLYISPTFIASTFLHFTYVFPVPEPRTIIKKLLIYLGSIFIIALVLTPTVIIQEVRSVAAQEKVIHFGSYYFIYALYIVFYFTFAFFRLFQKSRQAVGTEKARILYLLAGYSLAANFAFVTNLILPWMGYFQLNWVGQIFNIFIVVFTSLAIVRHQLMDIKLVARKYSVYLASLVTVIGFAFLVQWLFESWFSFQPLLFKVLLFVLGLVLFSPVKSYYYRLANRYLFSSLYDVREVITSLSNNLRALLDSQAIYDSVSKTLQSAFHPKGFAILLYDQKTKTYQVAFNQGITFPKSKIEASKTLYNFLSKQDTPLSLNDSDTQLFLPKDLQSLHLLGVEVIAPLNLKGTSIAVILLGAKESGDMYNQDDYSVLSVTGSQVAIAIDNARLYEEANHFNEVLRGRIAQATKKLRSQNDKLKELDQLKTEFISIASHQLRTPLTASKWALDFMAKGESGKLTKAQQESVEELSVMNHRLITLVNELLNISRLDEGRLKIDPKPTDIVSIIKQTLHEFMPIARKKGLKVVEQYDRIPLINLDPAVVSKAISNILSNGIKYNRDGCHLWVSVKLDNQQVLITVQDEGIGIPKKEQNHLFQKFYRASNATSSTQEGTGLGLYITKSAIELSGGNVSFESEEGKGTSFTVSLSLTGSKAQQGEGKGLV